MNKSSFNVWIGIGRLTKDPELKSTTNSTVCKIFLATTERYSGGDGDWKEQTDFIPCVLWGKKAEAIAKYCFKGTMIQVSGRLKVRKWEKDGVNITSIECRVDEWTILVQPKEHQRSASSDDKDHGSSPFGGKKSRADDDPGGSGGDDDGDYPF